jgi:hypothetical protein
MPYADPEARKRVQREAQARRRAAARQVMSQHGLMSTPINPTIVPILPPAAPPPPAVLYRLGEMIRCPRFRGEGDLAYHARLRQHWRHIRSVLD